MADMAFSAPQTSQFLSLPLEIRKKIYQALLTCPGELPVGGKGINRRHFNDYRGIFPSVILCCKQTYAEAFPIMYSDNHFQLEWDPDRDFKAKGDSIDDFVTSQYTSTTKLDLIKHFILPDLGLLTIKPVYMFDRFHSLEKLTIFGSAITPRLGAGCRRASRALAPVTLRDLPQRLQWFTDLTPVRNMTLDPGQMIAHRSTITYEFILLLNEYGVLPVSPVIPLSNWNTTTFVAFHVTFDEKASRYNFKYVWDTTHRDDTMLRVRTDKMTSRTSLPSWSRILA